MENYTPTNWATKKKMDKFLDTHSLPTLNHKKKI